MTEIDLKWHVNMRKCKWANASKFCETETELVWYSHLNPQPLLSNLARFEQCSKSEKQLKHIFQENRRYCENWKSGDMENLTCCKFGVQVIQIFNLPKVWMKISIFLQTCLHTYPKNMKCSELETLTCYKFGVQVMQIFNLPQVWMKNSTFCILISKTRNV